MKVLNMLFLFILFIIAGTQCSFVVPNGNCTRELEFPTIMWRDSAAFDEPLVEYAIYIDRANACLADSFNNVFGKIVITGDGFCDTEDKINHAINNGAIAFLFNANLEGIIKGDPGRSYLRHIDTDVTIPVLEYAFVHLPTLINASREGCLFDVRKDFNKWEELYFGGGWITWKTFAMVAVCCLIILNCYKLVIFIFYTHQARVRIFNECFFVLICTLIELVIYLVHFMDVYSSLGITSYIESFAIYLAGFLVASISTFLLAMFFIDLSITDATIKKTDGFIALARTRIPAGVGLGVLVCVAVSVLIFMSVQKNAHGLAIIPLFITYGTIILSSVLLLVVGIRCYTICVDLANGKIGLSTDGLNNSDKTTVMDEDQIKRRKKMLVISKKILTMTLLCSLPMLCAIVIEWVGFLGATEISTRANTAIIFPLIRTFLGLLPSATKVISCEAVGAKGKKNLKKCPLGTYITKSGNSSKEKSTTMTKLTKETSTRVVSTMDMGSKEN
jgi:hypothetical protein